MGKIILTLILLVSVAMADGIHWAKDFNSGIKTAQQENKPVLFVIASHECRYCNLLERTTFVDDRVIQQLNKNFVSIIVFVDDGDYFPRELQTGGLPTLWFLLPKGIPMFQPLIGAVKADAFLEALENVKKEFLKINKKRIGK